MTQFNSKQINKVVPLLQFLTIKQVSEILNVSIANAQKLVKDVKKQYDLKTKITIYHLIDYLKIPYQNLLKNTNNN